uniref:Uncharacterized protein n=1 Tax=Macrostomum lignano TaxID=282301 RepID=A0A1I8FU09_9PLAT
MPNLMPAILLRAAPGRLPMIIKSIFFGYFTHPPELFQLQYWTQHPSYPWRIPRSRFWRVQIVSLRQRKRTSGGCGGAEPFVCTSKDGAFTLQETIRGGSYWMHNCVFLLTRSRGREAGQKLATIAEVLAPSEGGLRLCSKAEINLDLPAFTMAAASAPATPSAVGMNRAACANLIYQIGSARVTSCDLDDRPRKKSSVSHERRAGLCQHPGNNTVRAGGTKSVLLQWAGRRLTTKRDRGPDGERQQGQLVEHFVQAILMSFLQRYQPGPLTLRCDKECRQRFSFLPSQWSILRWSVDSCDGGSAGLFGDSAIGQSAKPPEIIVRLGHSCELLANAWRRKKVHLVGSPQSSTRTKGPPKNASQSKAWSQRLWLIAFFLPR